MIEPNPEGSNFGGTQKTFTWKIITQILNYQKQTGSSLKKEESDNIGSNNLQVAYNYRSRLESCKKDDRSNAHKKF